MHQSDKNHQKFKDLSLMLDLEEKEFKNKIKLKDGKELWLLLNNTKKSMINGLLKEKLLLIKLKLQEKLP
jgi:hypothetical protein